MGNIEKRIKTDKFPLIS